MREQHTITVAGSGHESGREPDPGEPLDPHESHDMIARPRWHECRTCGQRDYWPGVQEACSRPGKGPKTKKDQGEPVTLRRALEVLAADVAAFGLWWIGRDLGDLRPSLDEWVAEFFEWRRVGSAA